MFTKKIHIGGATVNAYKTVLDWDAIWEVIWKVITVIIIILVIANA